MKTSHSILFVALIMAVLKNGEGQGVQFSPNQDEALARSGWQEPGQLSLKWDGNAISSVFHGEGRFVAVGQTGTLVTSADGRSWREIELEAQAFLRDATYDQDRFVAVGSNGTVLTSEDGLDWTDRSSKKVPCLYSVTYGEERFVAVGSHGAILTSPDGKTWIRRGSDHSEHLRSVAFGHGSFVAVGDQGRILSSSDGIEWGSGHPVTKRRLESFVPEDEGFRIRDFRGGLFGLHLLGHGE